MFYKKRLLNCAPKRPHSVVFRTIFEKITAILEISTPEFSIFKVS